MRQGLGCGRLFDRGSRSIEGSMKAAVLPVPVWAMPSRSRPWRRIGIAFAWIGVASLYSLSASAWRTGCDSPRFSNDILGVELTALCGARAAQTARGNAAGFGDPREKGNLGSDEAEPGPHGPVHAAM